MRGALPYLLHVLLACATLSAGCTNTAAIFARDEAPRDDASTELDADVEHDAGLERDSGIERDAQPGNDAGGEPRDAGLGVGDAGAFTSPGYEHTCALYGEDTYCWGRNSNGQLGIGANRTPETSPRWLSSSYQQLCAGEKHTCGLRADGAIECWGGNGNGQLGVNDQVTRDEPARVSAPTPFKSLACGGEQTCAIGRDERLYCWGKNSEGQIGLDDPVGSPPVLVPTAVVIETGIEQVSVGQGHVCALTKAGALHCWGRNSQGQLGLGDTPPEQVRRPAQVTPDQTYLAVAAGQTHSCAVRNDRRMFCWGQTMDGLLGIGAALPDYMRRPAQVGNLNDYERVDANWFHTCGLRTGGVLMCWGRNEEGQLCMGDTVRREQPAVLPLDSIRDLTIGHFHTCLNRAGVVYCCGKNDEGQLGLGDNDRRDQPTPLMFLR